MRRESIPHLNELINEIKADKLIANREKQELLNKLDHTVKVHEAKLSALNTEINKINARIISYNSEISKIETDITYIQQGPGGGPQRP